LPNASWPEILSRFRHVEDLGFDLATTADHFVDWNNPAVPWLEAWTLLAAAARETTRIRLATYVTQIPLRHPAMLARQALTVDHISGGRLEVGLGTGLTIDPAYDMIGIPNWEPKERVARFKEYVEIVDRLLSHETSSFEGSYYRIKDAAMNPRPVQRPRPPIVIAAIGPAMLRHAARHADNWNSLSFAASFERQLAETAERIARIDDACAAIGRDPSSLRRSYRCSTRHRAPPAAASPTTSPKISSSTWWAASGSSASPSSASTSPPWGRNGRCSRGSRATSSRR
jgi:alkanesulfonate monooxygenase SsuD/methylene tetrahydromethanopterin reductase-like flavin-dependent oxidoreductase (luciferase family)